MNSINRKNDSLLLSSQHTKHEDSGTVFPEHSRKGTIFVLNGYRISAADASTCRHLQRRHSFHH